MSREPAGLLTDEERKNYWDLAKEAAYEDALASGHAEAFRFEMKSLYEGDWEMKLDDWPEQAGIQVGEEWVPDSHVAEVAQATLVVGQRYKKTGRLRQSTLRKMVVGGGQIEKMREATDWKRLSEYFGSPDPFAYGTSSQLSGIGNDLNMYIPLWPGPVTRQLYWQDYWQMSAKAFEAYNHDPVSWRCVHLKAEFSLGRGLESKCTFSSGTKKGQAHDKAQVAWDEYWKRNKMDQRMDLIARDYCWGGEQFLRYFKQGKKLTVRALDPASIYDLITDPEDIETVFAYHQQFQTAYQLYPPEQANPVGVPPAPTGPSQKGAATRYIIRQILPQEIDHYKGNASAYERRGRSDLFPALGWIKRLRDYLTAHVVQSDMLARICWDLEVAGNRQVVAQVRESLFPGGRPPNPGTVFGHNTAATLSAVSPQKAGSSTSRGDPVLDALVTMVALSGGIPKDWLGFGLQNTRAGALVATEPAAKSLQELQGTLEGMIHDQFERVMRAAGVHDAEIEITFPSIATEDRQQKLDDLGTMEGNMWISKETAATLAAKEMDITTYDYESEQKKIAAEFPEPDLEPGDSGLLGPDGKAIKRPKQGDGKIRRSIILATKRQAPKLDPTKSTTYEDDPPGLMMPEDGSDVPMPAPGSHNGTGQVVPGGGSHKTNATRAGIHANENPLGAQGASNIRKDNTKLSMSEGEDGEVIISSSLLDWLLIRERQQVRRRPEDDEFIEDSRKFRQESKANLAELVHSVTGDTEQ